MIESARITITREHDPEDPDDETADLVGIKVSDGITALEALGMLELAKDYVLHDREDDDDE